MSTIAWDGKTLAGDRLGVRGEGLRFEVVKVFALSNGSLYGGVGKHDNVLQVLWWLENGGEPPNLGSEASFSGLVVMPEKKVHLFDELLVPKPVLESFFAIGSGRDFAIAAMALGQTAAQAIELAMRYDIYTGIGVDVVSLGGP